MGWVKRQLSNVLKNEVRDFGTTNESVQKKKKKNEKKDQLTYNSVTFIKLTMYEKLKDNTSLSKNEVEVL